MSCIVSVCVAVDKGETDTDMPCVHYLSLSVCV